tara:strand:- start:892 stop:1728 length:837 start_codon:yes stop_codon:yes gene_type:complete
MKTLILYAYCENQKGPTSCKNSQDNLTFFLDNGLINNTDYLFCININGSYNFNFHKYLEKFTNLKIFKGNGKSSFEAYLNIINNVNINNFDNFIFIKDKVRGPYHVSELSNNWIDYFINKLDNINCVIVSAYGTSPLGKIYKIPYIPMKFMVMNKTGFNLIMENDLFKKYEYDPRYLEDKRKIPDNMFEIGFSHYLLKNKLNYVALDKNKLQDLQINKYYPNFKKLLEISCDYYDITDTTIPDRIFWSNTTMKKIFNSSSFKNKIRATKRNSKNIEKW